MSKKLLALGSVILAASLAAGPAFATGLGGPPQPQSIVAYRSGPSLSTRAGADRVLSRIENAASEVCGGPPLPIELNLTERYDRCDENAISAAVSKADSPQLARAYASSTDMGASEGALG
jgi:UrcA family protein